MTTHACLAMYTGIQPAMSIDRSFIGREFPAVSLLVTRSRLRNFAKATGQDQPVYTDVDAAKQA